MGSGISSSPNEWVYIPNNKIETCELDIGKWIFAFPINQIENNWIIAKDIYYNQRENEDLRIIGIKCLNFLLYPILKECIIMFFFR